MALSSPGKVSVALLSAAAIASGCSSPDTGDGGGAASAAASVTAGAGGSTASSSSGTGGGGGGSGGADPHVAELHERADRALEAMLLSYWRGDSGYLRDEAPSGTEDGGYWIVAQAFDAVLDGVERTNGERYGGLIETLYQAQDARGWARDYYDDENWMALALTRAFDLTGDGKYLAKAVDLFEDIRANATDASCCGANPGGLWWNTAHTQKATASNAGPVITGARLSARTGDATQLAFAKDVYAYWWSTMVDPATHQVADHIAPGGEITTWKFTYNEGLMIGASLALYDATQDGAYLENAKALAAFVVASETKDGIVSDGTNSGCGGDCAAFKGIAARYLAALHAAAPADAEPLATLSTSTESLWAAARDPATTLFAVDWAGPPQTSVLLGAQGSAAMALAAAAAAAGPHPPTRQTPGKFEAEDGVLHHVGLEATSAGFGGWGYLAGWNGDGQWVDFPLDLPAAGTYTLTLRYAAGAGDASRLVYIDGKNAVPNLALPSTGAWTTYASKSTDVALPKGKTTLSIIYNASLGSTNYVNLDSIEIAPAP